MFPFNVLTRILNRTVGGSNNLGGPAMLKDLGGLVVPPALLRAHVVPWIIRGAETLTLAKGKYFLVLKNWLYFNLSKLKQK